MYAYIKGDLEEKSNGFVVIENNGIGYKIFMSNTAIGRLGELYSKVKVYTVYFQPPHKTIVSIHFYKLQHKNA